MKRKITKIILTISTTVLITILIFWVMGEWVLKNFTFYGVEFFHELGYQNVVLEHENFPYMSNFLAEKINNLKKSYLNGHAVTSPQNMYKILILGDSISAERGLGEKEDTFPARLKVLLKQDFPGKNIDIFVFANGGYSTVEEVEGYALCSKYFKPDLVILAYCHNDTAGASARIIVRNGKKLLAFYKTGNPYLSILPLNRFLTERFLVARFINEKSIELLSRLHLKPSVGFCNLAEQKIFNGFQRLSVLTKNTNTPVIVVVFPYMEDEIDISRARMSDLIKQWCARFNFLHIDLLSKFKEYNYRQLMLYPKDICHPNALGHKIAAETIERSIKRAGLIE